MVPTSKKHGQKANEPHQTDNKNHAATLLNVSPIFIAIYNPNTSEYIVIYNPNVSIVQNISKRIVRTGLHKRFVKK